KLSHHVLEPWLEYWRLSLRLEDMPATEVRAFLSKFERTYVAELLREEWLKVLGRRGDWQEFDRQAAFYSRDDLEVRCYGRASREGVVLAVVGFARSDAEGAAAALDGPLAARLPEADLTYLWGRVGYEAAREHYDKALAWYARAGDLRLTDEQLAWKARAAL